LRTVKVTAGEAAVESQFQRQLVLEQHFINLNRVQTIRFRLGRNALPFCSGRTKWKFGLAVANQYSFGPSDQPLARRAFGFRDRLQVLYVIPNSPAHQAGLRSGDYITQVNGTPIRPGADAKSRYLAAADWQSGKSLSLVIDRDGLKKTTLDPVEACDFKIKLTQSQRVAAQARGNGVSVSKGMLWFAGEQELAFVIAHEMVHVVRNHLSMIGRYGVQQKDVEAEADYIGLYIMARSGYDIAYAPRFWRRMAANFPRMQASARTHPATSYRFVAMRKAVAEINAKQASGRPLMPGSLPKFARAELGGATPGSLRLRANGLIAQ
jgi:PDZ domain/Peptidase family M48